MSTPKPEIVKPRIVNLFGDVYKPRPSPPARPGALAYASHPSVVGGARVPYRKSLVPSPTQEESQ